MDGPTYEIMIRLVLWFEPCNLRKPSKNTHYLCDIRMATPNGHPGRGRGYGNFPPPLSPPPFEDWGSQLKSTLKGYLQWTSNPNPEFSPNLSPLLFFSKNFLGLLLREPQPGSCWRNPYEVIIRLDKFLVASSRAVEIVDGNLLH